MTITAGQKAETIKSKLNVSWGVVAEKLGVTIGAIDHWRAKGTVPSEKSLKSLDALYLQVMGPIKGSNGDKPEGSAANPIPAKPAPAPHPPVRTPKPPKPKPQPDTIVNLIFDALGHVATCEIRAPECLTCRLAIVVSRVRPR